MISTEEIVAVEEQYLQEALTDFEDANREIEAAQQSIEAAQERKRKWTKDVDLKKGRFTEYCKTQGFKGVCDACIDKALKSDDKSVRGMAGFALAAIKMRKKKATEEVEAKKIPKDKNRPAAIFDNTNPKVKDDKDHFPIPDENHARNALARANQYAEAPSWYDGSLEDLKKTVADKVKSKFPDIEVTEESYE